MRCDEAQSELLLGQAPHAGAELEAHVQSCASCRAVVEQQRGLNVALSLDEPHRPAPGFDTRFFARLADERAAAREKRTRLSLRMWLWALVPAAAGVALLLARPDRDDAAPPEAQAPAALLEEPEDFALIMDEDPALLEDLEIVQKLEDLEDLDLLEGVDHAELDRLAAEASP
jgi:hypothetical protein